MKTRRISHFGILVNDIDEAAKLWSFHQDTLLQDIGLTGTLVLEDVKRACALVTLAYHRGRTSRIRRMYYPCIILGVVRRDVTDEGG